MFKTFDAAKAAATEYLLSLGCTREDAEACDIIYDVRGGFVVAKNVNLADVKGEDDSDIVECMSIAKNHSCRYVESHLGGCVVRSVIQAHEKIKCSTLPSWEWQNGRALMPPVELYQIICSYGPPSMEETIDGHGCRKSNSRYGFHNETGRWILDPDTMTFIRRW